jgi:hypothetical protein
LITTERLREAADKVENRMKLLCGVSLEKMPRSSAQHLSLDDLKGEAAVHVEDCVAWIKESVPKPPTKASAKRVVDDYKRPAASVQDLSAGVRDDLSDFRSKMPEPIAWAAWLHRHLPDKLPHSGGAKDSAVRKWRAARSAVELHFMSGKMPTVVGVKKLASELIERATGRYPSNMEQAAYVIHWMERHGFPDVKERGRLRRNWGPNLPHQWPLIWPPKIKP